MNAHSPISRIAMLMPECTDTEEQDLRERLLKARDVATREMARRWQSPASALVILIADIAAEWSFRAATIDQLKEARATCIELMRLVVKVEELGESAGG